MSTPPESGSLEPGVIERATQLLKLLATAGRRGMGLSDIAKASALANSTAHRLLQQLIQARLVMQPESGRRYSLGPLAFELGLAAAASFDLRHYCRQGMEHLAETLGDTVYLSVRSGFEAVCQERVEGGVCQGSWNLIHAASNTGSVSCSC